MTVQQRATATVPELQAELTRLTALTAPMYVKLESFTEAELVGTGRQYFPYADVRAIQAELQPLQRETENVRIELANRERDARNSALWDRKQAAIAAAPVYQRCNGWEIVRLAEYVNYFLRDPQTKEEVYSGCLRRCREVAKESKPC